jgi:hypothetical protein
MPKQIIVRLYKGGLNGELVANSQIITLEGLGDNPVSGRDFTDGKLTGTVSTGGQYGVFYKRLAKPFWTVSALYETVKATQAFTFNWTVNIPYTENTIKWYVVDPSTDLPYSGLGISTSTMSGVVVPSGSGQTGSFTVNTTPVGTVQNFQVALFNGDIGTSTLLARSNTCFIDPVVFTIAPPSPREVRYGTSVNFTVTAYANEAISWTGANIGSGVTNSLGVYTGTFGDRLPPGVNTMYFTGNITQTETIYTVNVFTESRLEVTGPETGLAGSSVMWTIKSEPNEKVYWRGIHDINDSGDVLMPGSGITTRNFGKALSGTYTWTFTGDGVPNSVTKQLVLGAPSGLGINYQPEYFYLDPILVNVTGTPLDTITWTYVPGTLQEPAYFDYFPEAAEAYNNSAGELEIPTTIQGIRDGISAADFAKEVHTWYRLYLKRTADTNGLDYWVNQLVNDRSRGLSEIRGIVENGIKTSPEAIEVASTGQRKPALTKSQFAQEHYRLNPAGRFSPEDAEARESKFPITGNTLTLSTGAVGTGVATLTQVNMIPRSTPYRFRFSGITSAPPKTADIIIKKTYNLTVTPDLYPSGSTLLATAILILTVSGAPGEYVRVWNASNPSLLIHSWTTNSGNYSFNLLQYAVSLANGSHTFVFDGDKTPNQPTYTLTISAAATLTVTSPTNLYFEGRPIPLTISGAKEEEISWTYTVPTTLNTVGRAYFDYYESVAQLYRNDNRNGLSEDAFARAHYNKWGSRIQTLMSPDAALNAVKTVPALSGKFANRTNSVGALTAELNTELSLKARTTPYKYIFDGDKSSGNPSLDFTIKPPNTLSVEAPSKGYVGRPVPINVLGAPNDTVVVIRGTQPDIRITLNAQGRSTLGFDVAQGGTFVAGTTVRFEFRGQITLEEVYKDIAFEAVAVEGSGATVDSAAIRLITYRITPEPVGGATPEYSNNQSRWSSTTRQFQLYYEWENAYDVTVRASPGYAYSQRQSFEVQGPNTRTQPGQALHTPGKSHTYRLFARGQDLNKTLNTGQINTTNKPGLYNPGYEDRISFVSTPWEINRGSEHWFVNYDKYILWRPDINENVYPTRATTLRYITMGVYYSVSSGEARSGYNISIYDAYTNAVTDEVQTFTDFGNWGSQTSGEVYGFAQVYLYAKPTTNYISGAFTANVVVREGSAVGSGAIISWQLVTLLDPADTGTPSATTNTNLGSSTIEDTTPLSVEILNDKNNTFTGDGITARIKGATGSVVNISAGFGEGSNPITTITLSSPSQDVLISSYISSFGIYSVVAESKGKSARDSINIQLSAGD